MTTLKVCSSKPAVTTDIIWSLFTNQDTNKMIKTTPKGTSTLHSTVNWKKIPAATAEHIQGMQQYDIILNEDNSSPPPRYITSQSTIFLK